LVSKDDSFYEKAFSEISECFNRGGKTVNKVINFYNGTVNTTFGGTIYNQEGNLGTITNDNPTTTVSNDTITTIIKTMPIDYSNMEKDLENMIEKLASDDRFKNRSDVINYLEELLKDAKSKNEESIRSKLQGGIKFIKNLAHSITVEFTSQYLIKCLTGN